MSFDVIIYNGEIVDGSGKPSFKTDIGIKNDRIDAMGDLSEAESAERINAKGLIVAPGFIDIHTHSDFTLLVNGSAESQVHQGVTLEVIGNCGHSAAPLNQSQTIENLVPGIMSEININWKSFGEYLERLDQQDLGLNVIALVGHGTLRRLVMKDELRPATERELKEMVKHLEKSLEEGARGLSSGLEYWPGIASTPEELFPLCETVKRYNAIYTTHVRNRDINYDLGFSEALAMARNTGVRLQISHIQPKFGAPGNAMEQTLEMVDWSSKAGADIAFDIIPHEWNHTRMTEALPSWAFEGGLDKLISRLNDMSIRENLKINPKPVWQLVKEKKWEKIRLLKSKKNSDLIGKTFTEIGCIRNKDPFDAYFDLLIEEGKHLNDLMWTSHAFLESDIELCLQQSSCVVTSDTKALAPYGVLKGTIGSLSGYGWIPRLFQHYVREKSIISLEDAVHKVTGLPAERLKLKNRGYMRPGGKADITIFDLKNINDLSTISQPCVYPSGIVHVLVNGKFVLKNCKRMQANPGEVIK